MLTLIYGKMERLDMLYAARESIPTSTSGRAETFRDFIKNGTYDEKYAKFRDCLAVHLSIKTQLDVEESKKVVDKTMAVYMKKYFDFTVKYILIHKTKKKLDHLRLPDWIDKGIRAPYRKIFLPKQTNDLPIFSDTSSQYYDDFNKIRLHVLSYSKK